MELRNGDDDMEKASSLKAIVTPDHPDPSQLIIVNDSRFFNTTADSIYFLFYIRGLEAYVKRATNYGPFTLIIIMRSQTSLTYC
jgi:hypothetical protein